MGNIVFHTFIMKSMSFWGLLLITEKRIFFFHYEMLFEIVFVFVHFASSHPSPPIPLFPLASPSLPCTTSDGRVVLHPSNGVTAFCTFAYFFPPKFLVGKNSLRSTLQYCAFFAFFLPSGSAKLSLILKAKFGYIIGRRRRKFESDCFRKTKED